MSQQLSCHGMCKIVTWSSNFSKAAKWINLSYGSVMNLTHLGRVMHLCVSKLPSIVSDNGLSPGRRQAIIWNNAGIVFIGPLGRNFSKILIKIHTFSLKKIHLKMSSATMSAILSWPQCVNERHSTCFIAGLLTNMFMISLTAEISMYESVYITKKSL